VSAPRIGGMEDWYLERQLVAFREGWRGAHPDDYQGGEMRAMALALDGDGEVRAASERFAAYPASRPPATVQGDAERGRALYGACVACHGADGKGNAELQSPALARQSDWYLVTQLQNYRDGLRGGDQADTLGQQMRAVVGTLRDDAAIRDVVTYVNTLD
jgi:cytochrome c oxidase subunit 2